MNELLNELADAKLRCGKVRDLLNVYRELHPRGSPSFAARGRAQPAARSGAERRRRSELQAQESALAVQVEDALDEAFNCEHSTDVYAAMQERYRLRGPTSSGSWPTSALSRWS